VVCGHNLQTTQAPFVGGSVNLPEHWMRNHWWPCDSASLLLFPEMTFLQREGGTKGIKRVVKVKNNAVLCALGVRYKFGTTEGEKEWPSGP
jgi:hypothetical protein